MGFQSPLIQYLKNVLCGVVSDGECQYSAYQGTGCAPGQGSIMRDPLTDLAALPLMFPIAIMQSALPAVGTAVNRYGLYRHDPQRLSRRTNWPKIRFL